MTDNKFTPPVTPQMYKAVSQYRREQLEGEVENGTFRDGSGRAAKGVTSTPLSYAVSGVSPFTKFGQMTDGASAGNSFRGGAGNVNSQIPEVYSPLWLTSNLNLPRDRATMNAWCRSFYALNPIVQNAINLHSTYPISKLNIKCPNKKVERFFSDMIEEIDLMNICAQAAQEYWLLGETFIYGELDERNAKWSRLHIQNPDYIVVKKSVIASEPAIMLKPDENLRRICTSNLPADIDQRKQLNETIINYVRRGQNIPLDNMYVSHLARRISPYEARGTGLPVSIFRSLMLFDMIKECKFAQAQDMINPMRIIKIGGGTADYRATPVDLDAWREVWAAATSDKNFKIFTHDAVTVETIGAGQGIYDTTSDFAQLLKEMYAGLMIPQIVIEGGGDISYANGGISLDVLRQRYMQFRNMMSAWLRRKIFQPISKLNEFYDYVDGEKTLIVPEIDWNHMSLFDLESYVSTLKELTGEQKRVSVHTLYRSLGLEWDDERRKIRKEDIAEAIRKKEQSSLEKMNLNELRTLNEEDEIPELLDAPLPGMGPNDDAPSGGGGGLPGMDAPGGGLPAPPELPGGPPAP
jgi:hypothetical protein